MQEELTGKFIERQKEKLLQCRSEILNSLKRSQEEGLRSLGDEKLSDETDLAQIHIDQSLTFSLRDRDLARLKEIDEALSRIHEGTYGYCEESGEPIEIRRLQKQPWAKLSLYYAEQMERERGLASGGRVSRMM